MCKSRLSTVTLVAAVGLATATSTRAVVIFDNFAPVNVFDTVNSGLIIDNAPGVRLVGASFVTPSSPYPWQLDSIELPLAMEPGSVSSNTTLDVQVRPNASPGVPSFGSISSGFATVPNLTDTPTIRTATYSGAVLQPSTQYWVVVNGNSNRGGWFYNSLGQVGQAVRQGNSNSVWGFGPNDPKPAFRINATPLPPECYLTNPGFEDSEFTAGGPPITVNDWAGDASTITGAALGVSPHSGQRMLQFDGTAPGGGSPTSVGSEVWQLIDVSHLSADIAAGNVFADFEFHANRVSEEPDAQPTVDTLFSARLQANSGSPASFPTNVNNYLGISTSQLVSDNDSNTWQRLSTSMQVPVGTTFLAVRVAAIENVINDSSSEFAGHFADSACLQLRVVPEPSSVALTSLLLGMVVVRYRSSTTRFRSSH